MSSCQQKLRALVTVEPVIFLFMMSVFIQNTAYQQLVISKVCSDLFGDSPVCSDPEKHPREDEEVQISSSIILLLYTLITSLLSIPPALFLGSWSDRASRRVVLLLPCLLSLASAALMLTMALEPRLSVYISLAAAGLVGLSGGTVSIFLSSFSFLADLTEGTGANRTLRMATAESMIFVGGAVGFLLGGVLADKFGLFSAFAAVCCCHTLSVFYILVWLRDPATGHAIAGVATTSAPAARTGILSLVRRTVTTVMRKRPGQERLKLHLLIICTFLNNLVAVGEFSILFLFLTYEPREFTTELYGIFNSCKMLLLGFVLLVLFPLMLRCVGQMTLAKLSALCRTAAYITLAFSTNTWMVFLVAVVGAPSGITQAVIRSVSSSIVAPDEQGAMFSFTASVEATCMMISGIIFNGLYPLTLATFPGTCFIIMATFTLIVFILMQ
ncbi:proton-coupled folate transporter [Osmerus eperlanus]|uniref:proton-coupled folate transporter n=1 Tax=Osmerus eperlanus TaxID=29151 RepID=UPI002E124D37